VAVVGANMPKQSPHRGVRELFLDFGMHSGRRLIRACFLRRSERPLNARERQIAGDIAGNPSDILVNSAALGDVRSLGRFIVHVMQSLRMQGSGRR
jgi:hypothetical protein